MSESSGQWSVISGRFEKRLRRVDARWENKILTTEDTEGHRVRQGYDIGR